MFLASEDGWITPSMLNLDRKFHFLQEYQNFELKYCSIVTYKRGPNVLYGCIVRAKKDDSIDFIALEKCLDEIKKVPKKGSNQNFVLEDEEVKNKTLESRKVINVIIYSLTNITLYTS